MLRSVRVRRGFGLVDTQAIFPFGGGKYSEIGRF